jgi:hypothetical protein
LYKYLLNPTLIQGTEVTSARATNVPAGNQWSILLIVEAIPGGVAQISGDFSEKAATDLANALQP